MVCNNVNVGGTCQSNIYIHGRTQGFPAEHHPSSRCLLGCHVLPRQATDTSVVNQNVIHQAQPPSSTGPCGPVLTLIYPLLAPLMVERGQHGDPDLSAAMHPLTQLFTFTVWPLKPSKILLFAPFFHIKFQMFTCCLI